MTEVQSPHDIVGGGAQIAVHLLQAMMENFEDQEKLHLSERSMEPDGMLVSNSANISKSSIDGLVHDLSEDIAIAIKFVTDRENNRKDFASVKKESCGNAEKMDECHDKKSPRTLSKFISHEEGKGVEENSSKHVAKSRFGKTVQRRLQCNECEKSFTSRPNLTTHQMSHLPDGDPRKEKFACEQCGKIYSYKSALRGHMKSHLDNVEARLPHKCEKCGRRFSRLMLLRNHMQTHLPADVRNKTKVQCEVCGQLICTADKLAVHMRIHQEDETLRLPYKCEICYRRFGQAGVLSRHMRTHMGRVRNPIPLSPHFTHSLVNSTEIKPERKCKCDECGKGFDHPAHLNLHRKIHSSSDAVRRSFVCDVCGKAYTQKGDLKRHMAEHGSEEGKKPYSCDECGKTFARRDKLYQHVRVHADYPADDPRLKPFECDVCGKRVTTNRCLTEHKRLHLVDEDARFPYKCGDCGRRFTYLTHFNTHQRDHLSENDPKQRPYKCEECGKEFTLRQSLRSHMSRHTGIFPLYCTLCSKGFTDARCLKSHMKTHDNGEIGVSKNDDSDPRRSKIEAEKQLPISEEVVGCASPNQYSDDDNNIN